MSWLKEIWHYFTVNTEFLWQWQHRMATIQNGDKFLFSGDACWRIYSHTVIKDFEWFRGKSMFVFVCVHTIQAHLDTGQLNKYSRLEATETRVNSLLQPSNFCGSRASPLQRVGMRLTGSWLQGTPVASGGQGAGEETTTQHLPVPWESLGPSSWST